MNSDGQQKPASTPSYNGGAIVQGARDLRIGVDVGGTFTDLVVAFADGRTEVFKVSTVPKDPSAGVIDAIRTAAKKLDLPVGELLGRCNGFVHGSTIATNTVLERKGAKVGLLTTKGFRDSIAIRRGIRNNPWDHRTPFAQPLVPRYLRLGIGGRLDFEGTEIEPVSEADLEQAIKVFSSHGVEAVAVCFLNSYANGKHEQIAEQLIRKMGCDLPLSLSSNLSPIMGEYERGSTTVIDAFIRMRVVSYLKALDLQLRELGLNQGIRIVQSNSGTISIDRVARAPVAICLSGPAAGVGAMRYFGKMSGTQNLIAMEIGGTSCDVTMVREDKPHLVDLFEIGGYCVAQPAIEIHTVGAGGGTIAKIDEGGMLACGPQGAGADPGPACYRRGGAEPTTTDALVVAGRMKPGKIASGAIDLDADLAHNSIRLKIAEPLGISVKDAAVGIISLLEQNLLHAVEEISVKRGVDPAGFTLIAAGGAGPMHGSSVGRALGCRRVYVPRHAGVFCAVGMLDSQLRLDFAKLLSGYLGEGGLRKAEAACLQLRAEAEEEIARENVQSEKMFEVELNLTYKGQLRSLRIAWNLESDTVEDLKTRFEEEHRRTYGHIKPLTPIEISGIRLIVSLPAANLAVPRAEPSDSEVEPKSTRYAYVGPGDEWAEVPVYSGDDLGAGTRLSGPLIVEELTMTLFAGRGDVVTADPSGNFLIELE